MCCCGRNHDRQCPTWVTWSFLFICSLCGHETVAGILLSDPNVGPIRAVVIASMFMVFLASTLVTIYRFLHRWRPYNYLALLLVLGSMTMLIVTYTRHADITGVDSDSSSSSGSDSGSGSSDCYYDYDDGVWVGCGYDRRKRGWGSVFEWIIEEGTNQGIDVAASKSLLLTLPILDGLEGWLLGIILLCAYRKAQPS